MKLCVSLRLQKLQIFKKLCVIRAKGETYWVNALEFTHHWEVTVEIGQLR